MALNQYIVRTDGLFGIALDSDVVALRRSYVNSQLMQIIDGLKVLDSKVPPNVESLDRANDLFKEVKPMLHWPECDQFLKGKAVRLHDTYLNQRKDIGKRKTTDPLTQSPPKPASHTPPRKPPPPPPPPQTVPFHIPYEHPVPNFIVALPGAPPPPPPPPPPPAKSAQSAMSPKTTPNVQTKGGAHSKEQAPLNFDSELAKRLLRQRNAVNGPDSSSLGRVRAPPVRIQENIPPVNMIGQDAATSKHQRPAIVDEEQQDWSD